MYTIKNISKILTGALLAASLGAARVQAQGAMPGSIQTDYLAIGPTIYMTPANVWQNDEWAMETNIARDLGGNVYIAGTYYNDLQQYRPFIRKVSPTGAAIWTSTVSNAANPSSYYDYARGAAVSPWDPASVYLLSVQETNSGRTVTVTKYLQSGAKQWEQSAPANWGNNAYAISVGTDTVYVAGTKDNDIAIFRFAVSDGTPQTTIIYDGGDYYNVAYSIAQNADYIALAGTVYDSKDWSDPNDKEYGNEIWVAKYSKAALHNSTANPVWASTYTSSNHPEYGYDEAHAVKMDLLGNVYAAGFYYDYDSGADIWLGKYDVNGNLMYAKRKNGPSNGYDKGFGLTLDAFGNIYVVGKMESWSNNQANNAWIGKYSPGGALMSEISVHRDDELGFDVVASTTMVVMAGGFNQNFGLVYIQPQHFGTPPELFAGPGQYTGSVNLGWLYGTAGTYEYAVQYSTSASVTWDRSLAQVNGTAVTSQDFDQSELEVHGLPVRELYDGSSTGPGPEYYFKAWTVTPPGNWSSSRTLSNIAHAAPAAPYNYWYGQNMGQDNFWVFQSAYGPSSAIVRDGTSLYAAFGGQLGDKQGMALLKMNAWGGADWVSYYNYGQGNARVVPSRMTKDALGNVYVFGSIEIDGSGTGADAWIAKFTPAGLKLWDKVIAGPGDDEFMSAAFDSGNSLYAGGMLSDPSGNAMLLAKFNPVTGVMLDTTTFRGDSDTGVPAAIWGLAVDGSDNIFGGGFFSYDLSGSAVDQDAAIVKFNTSLDVLDSTRYMNTPVGIVDSEDVIAGLVVSGTEIYAVGSKFTHGAGDYPNFWVANISAADFSETWSATYPSPDAASGFGSEAVDLKLDSNYLYATGYEVRDNGMGGQTNMLLRKFDVESIASGPLWTKTVDGTYQDESVLAGAVEMAGDGYFFVSGLFNVDMQGSGDGNPGFARLAEPISGIAANMGPKPCSVDLAWVSEAELPQGTTFFVQYSTADATFTFDEAQAQYSFSIDFYAGPGSFVSHMVPGLEAGQGAPAMGDNTNSPRYYFKMGYKRPSDNAATEIGYSTNAVANTPGAWDRTDRFPNGTLFVINQAHGGSNPLIRDAEGNIYTAGKFDAWGWNSKTAYVRKFTRTGVPVWTRYWSDEYQESDPVINGLALDTSGYLYAVGSAGSEGCSEYNYLGYCSQYESGTKQDMLAIKFAAADGRMQWAKTYNVYGDNDALYGAAVGPSGLYVAGKAVNDGADEAIVGKIDYDNGDLLASGSLPFASYNAVAYEPYSDRVLAVGRYGTDGAPVSAPPAGARPIAGLPPADPNAYMQLYDAADLATVPDSASADYGDEDEFYAVKVDTVNGAVYLAGAVGNDGAQDAYLVKYSTSDFGTALWTKVYNSANQNADEAYGLALDGLGGVYLSGTEFRYDLNQGKNLFVRKYNESGSLLWTQTMNSAGNNEDIGGGIAVDPVLGGVYAAVDAQSMAGTYNTYDTINGAGFFKHTQLNLNTKNPHLTVIVSSGSPTAGALQQNVQVAVMGFSQTGGIDPNSINMGFTGDDGSGKVDFELPAGKSYFVAIASHNWVPTISDQISDPGGNFFVTLNESTTKQYYITPRSTSTAGVVYKMSINITTHTASDGTVYLDQGDYVMGEVFISQTGERVAYSVIPMGGITDTMEIYNLPAADNGVYGMAISVPARSKVLQLFMDSSFPSKNTYTADMAAASQLSGSFEVGDSTTPPSVVGMVTDANWSPLEGARVRMERWQCTQYADPPTNTMCIQSNTVYSKETLTDAGGSFAFYDVPYVECTGPGVPPTCQGNEGYSVNIGKSGYESANSWVNLPSGTPLPVMVQGWNQMGPTDTFQLALATYTLSGILKYNGVPLPNATVMVFPDWENYNYDSASATDSYRYSENGNSMGIRTDARVRTAADGSFTFTGLTDGNARLEAAFEGGWRSLNEGNDFESRGDNMRVVISSLGATSTNLPPNNGCRAGRVWVLDSSGTCKSFGSVAFNIVPQNANTAGRMYGNVTFITTYTVTAASPLSVSTSAPLTIMAQQECRDNCSDQQMGFTSISGTLTSNTTNYSITLSTGYSYYPRIFSTNWARSSSFDMSVNLEEGATSYRLDLSVLRAGAMNIVMKLPDGTNFKPQYGDESSPSSYWAEVRLEGVNLDFGDGRQPDEYGELQFPNLPPGTYKITVRGEGAGFVWALSESPVVTVTEGKTTEVKLQLVRGLAVKPQIFGLPAVSTASWSYNIVGVPSGTEMNQKKITDLFFSDPEYSFEYSSSTGWDMMYMPEGQYDFYLLLGARYDPCDGGGCEEGKPPSYDQFGNFIGRARAVSVKKSDSNPNLGTADQPIPVNVLGSVGQARMEGTIDGSNIFTDADMDRFFANFEEIFGIIPALMLYDSAGDLRGFSMGMPMESDFMSFMTALQSMDKDTMRSYMNTYPLKYGVWGIPPGRYTAVFSNPNYPPVAKEITLPDNADYDFDFDDEDVLVGAISGVVKSSTTGLGLSGARVYLKHRTVEKFAVTDSSGNFSFTNLPPGIYRMEVTRNGYVTAGVKTSLAGNDSSSFTMYMVPSSAKITGRVFLSKFPTQVTKAGVKLVAYDETQNVENPEDYLPKTEVQTDASGNYEITGVIPGHLYKVSVFYTGKLAEVMDVTAQDGNTVLSDLTLKDIPPQITIKVKKSGDSVNKVDVVIKSPKTLISAPVCTYNPGQSFDENGAVSLALVPGPNKTYLGQFTVSSSQDYYTVKVTAGDGGKKMEKVFVYDQNSKAKTEQYIQQESLAGGEIQMDKETEEYSGIELDPGALSYSTVTTTTDYSNLVGGFFSSLPSVRTVKTDKGNLTITQAIQDMMASEVYNMDLSNASANKAFTLTLKYDKEKGAGHSNEMRIYQQDENGNWVEVPGNYTVDPMLGVLSVDVASLTSATEGTGGVTTPLGRKKFGMSSVVNGRYVPSATSTSQSGRFAVFTANPPTGTAAYSSAFEVVNMPNPFNLKSKNVDLDATDLNGASIADPYPTTGTVIKYNLPAGKSGNVKFVIYNLAGEKVRTISEGYRAGNQVLYSEWDGRNDNNQKCASGVYFMLTYVDGKKLGNKAHKMAIIK